MTNYGMVYGSERPQDIEITPNSVFIASDVTPYIQEIDGRTISGYKYNYCSYTKDEYLLTQAANIAALQEELAAAKILLGVE